MLHSIIFVRARKGINMDFSQFSNHFLALLVIANPLSALPAVLRITRHQSLEEKKQTGLISAFAVALIFLIVVWCGLPLLKLFGIQIPAFQVAGSVIVFLLALSMLNAEATSPMKQSVEEQKEKRDRSGAIVPLAIPIIAGPGAISTLIVSVADNPAFTDQLLLTISSLLVAFVMGILLYFASHLERFFGQSGINIVNRIGGLILAAIAVQGFATGLTSLFPGLAGLSL